MLSIERILCPVDLSPGSDEGLVYALALARAYRAKLFVCYCERRLPGSDPGSLGERAAAATIAEVFRLEVERFEGVELDWEAVVTQGPDVGEAVTQEAAARHVDLIVMRSRRRPRAAALLGSTAEAVCRTAPCPVLVTHPHEREWVAGSHGTINLRRVLVAYDFSDDAELALRYGLSLAQEYQSELHLLHVLPLPLLEEPELSWSMPAAEGAYHQAARGLQKAVPAEAHLWCGVRHAVRCGKPYREVLAYAKENEIDLICMGARGTGFGMQSLFGSNVDRVLRQAPCPLLVARPLRPAALAAHD